MVAPTGSPPNTSAMDGIATTTKVRPTQSYYVPRPVLEKDHVKEEKETSPRDKKKAPCAQLYTPPHSRGGQTPSTPKLRPLMDIQIDRACLFADSSTSSNSRNSMTLSTSSESSSRKSPDVPRKSPEAENRRGKQRKPSAEHREELFPKIVAVPSSSSSGPTDWRNAGTPPREGFSTNILPPPPQPAVKDGCICEREKAHIACKRCGHECHGRLALVCLLHPMQMNLMDLSACPNPLCHSVQLYEVVRHW
ncbi:hypothetical protein PRIPAC_94689 [Pristionchus pacificus]|uniref:Uncharacterized protein n=1 Tax=Pristionchus pacificus TaxID=54126 RepID=A0A2A6CD35_PRIPA|nr:hypothetical protein PRIPAC_94689 [Pristionchus pacificus]|eukprot:PDM76104.1 hypothetical protein PRIPAC_39708 [Pristionchus pacificus]